MLTPLFHQLYDGIKGAILVGHISPGMQLPPTRDLSLQLGISRQTVLNAYSQLMAEGLKNSGVFRTGPLTVASYRSACSTSSVPWLALSGNEIHCIHFQRRQAIIVGRQLEHGAADRDDSGVELNGSDEGLGEISIAELGQRASAEAELHEFALFGVETLGLSADKTVDLLEELQEMFDSEY